MVSCPILNNFMKCCFLFNFLSLEYNAFGGSIRLLNGLTGNNPSQRLSIKYVNISQQTYRSFATRVSATENAGIFLVIGIEGNTPKYTFNGYSVITQFA